MDSWEGDLGIPASSKPSPRSPPLRAATLPPPLAPPPHHPAPASRPQPHRSTSTHDPLVPPRHHRKRDTLTRRISFPVAALEPSKRQRINRWLLAFVLVDFDIDTGPNLDNAYPPVRFPAALAQNIAFSSLPVGEMHRLTENGYCYSWRIPYPPEEELERAEKGKGKEIERLPVVDEGDGALHGFVWFAQEKNDRIRRGYSQRSLVLLTHHPHLPGLFASALSILGPLHFKHAATAGTAGGMVETACHNIASWPDPTPGATLELPFLGSVLTVSLPLPSQAQYPSLPKPSSLHPHSFSYTPPSPFLSSPSPALPPILPASIPTTPLCVLLFSPSSATEKGGTANPSPVVGYSKLLLLWELLVLGEPLLVVASDPRTGSEVVGHLKNLMRPIPFAGDSRPYFHVHDADFPRFCRPNAKPPPGLLLASTNPLVLSTCKHWPHVLRLDRPSPALSSLSPSASLHPPKPKPRTASASSTNGPPSVGAGFGAGEAFGLKSERKRHVKKDEAVRKDIEGRWARGDYLGCDAAIYQHFSSLTERFLGPLNRYFGTAWAAAAAANERAGRGSSPQVPPTTAHLFLPPSTAFLSSLRTHGSSLPLRTTTTASISFSQPGTTPLERFYLRFLTSAGFRTWLERREGDMAREGRRRWGEEWGREGKVEGWWNEGEGRSEGEVDELVRRLESEA
ncbi:hypothetical protein JCM1840_005037, partial [Sporobolomyces johnsonii]